MKILFFDTETSGLPINWKAPASDINNWPRLIQLGYIYQDEERKELKQGNYIIKPFGFTIPTEASDVHGISTEKALAEGLDLGPVLDVFHQLVSEADVLVAHNMAFDEKIMGAEFIRNGKSDIIAGKSKICTMLKSIDFCAIPGKYGYKWPKLEELHIKLFGHNFVGAHDAMADIEATERCFWELKSKGIIVLPQIRPVSAYKPKTNPDVEIDMSSFSKEDYIFSSDKTEQTFNIREIASLPPEFDQKICFDVGIQKFASLFGPEKAYLTSECIYINISEFKSISYYSIDELPYRKIVPVLKKQNRDRFIEEVYQKLFSNSKIEYIYKLRFSIAGVALYDETIENSVKGLLLEIPHRENRKRNYKNPNLIKSKMNLVYQEYKHIQWKSKRDRSVLGAINIGYTMQRYNPKIKGGEISIWVDFNGDQSGIFLRVYLPDLISFEVEVEKGVVREYFIHTASSKKHLLKLYKMLADQYQNFRVISSGKCFEEGILDIWKESRNYKKFDFEINTYYKILMYPDGRIKEERSSRRENYPKKLSWESASKYSNLHLGPNYLPSRISSRMEELADSKMNQFDQQDRHDLSDLESDFYSGLF
ncbi:MAG: 3'-5' exonuclease [Crocinitomicaceae bacterium]|nr:3'-5' exonuclease [Crocinitomicaceae bacterium]